MTLTVRDHMTLRLEAQRWRYVGAKASHVYFVFSESMTRYCQRRDALIDRADAEAEYPVVVHRLRRLRDERRRQRGSQRVSEGVPVAPLDALVF